MSEAKFAVVVESSVADDLWLGYRLKILINIRHILLTFCKSDLAFTARDMSIVI